MVARGNDTGSRSSLLGEAVAGPLQGKQTAWVTAVDTFWFAAKAFQAELTLADVGEAGEAR